MTQNNITEGSKLIAEFLGWKYIPFNDLQNLKKAGWYQFESGEPNIQTVDVTSWSSSNPEKVTKKQKVNMTPLRHHHKNGWEYSEGNYYKYVCRAHTELRFYNSFDALMPAIEKLEKEFENIHFELLFGGCTLMSKNTDELFIDSFKENLSWIQNTFNVVVETIKNIKDATE